MEIHRSALSDRAASLTALRRRLLLVVLAAVAVVLALLGGPAQASAPSSGGWRLLPVPLSSRFYSQISCVGPARCWVPFSSQSGGGAGVLATADGGSVWSAEHLPGHAAWLSGISCTSPVDCWAVGYSGLLGRRSAGVAFRTVDGGARWTELTLPAELGPGLQTQFFGISCRGPRWCTAVGTGPLPKVAPNPANCGAGCTGVPTGPAPPGLLGLTTTDAGATWSVARLPITSGATLNGLSCGTPGACQAVGLGFTDCRPRKPGAGTTCSAAGAAVGLRGGASWVSEPVGGGIFNLYSVSCTSATQCWASGSTGNDVQGHGVILHTSDSGVRWAHEPPATGSNSLTGISCPTQAFCVAVGGLGPAGHVTPVIETTTDGGARWVAGPAPAGLSQILGVTCAAPGHCLATGIEGYGPDEHSVLLTS